MTVAVAIAETAQASNTRQLGGWRALAASLIVGISFLPYVALPVGNSSNIPAVALLGAIAVPGLIRRPRILLLLAATAAMPLVALFSTMVLSGVQPTLGSFQASLLWAAQVVLPMSAWIWAASTRMHATFLALNVGIIASSVYVLVQSLFLRAGVLPFLDLYWVPGYWSVQANADTITRYIRRPFGWFPEPSFMAGTISLACILMVLLARALGQRAGILSILSLAVAISALIISVSGAAALALLLLSVVVLLSRGYFPGGKWLILPAIFIAAGASLELVQSRSATTINYSWDDRYASFVAPLRYMASEPGYWIAGIGKGSATVMAKSGSLDYSGLSALHRTEDVVSVAGRLIIENGLFGVVFVASMVVIVFVVSTRLLGTWAGAASGLLWLVVAGPTISYDSAVFIWAVPAVCFALVTPRRVSRGLHR